MLQYRFDRQHVWIFQTSYSGPWNNANGRFQTMLKKSSLNWLISASKVNMIKNHWKTQKTLKTWMFLYPIWQHHPLFLVNGAVKRDFRFVMYGNCLLFTRLHVPGAFQNAGFLKTINSILATTNGNFHPGISVPLTFSRDGFGNSFSVWAIFPMKQHVCFHFQSSNCSNNIFWARLRSFWPETKRRHRW